MAAINFSMTDIYGGYAGTTEKTIPDNDDKKALTDTTTTENAPVIKNTLVHSSNMKMYMAIALVLILVIVIGGRL